MCPFRLKVVEPGRRAHGIAERLVFGHIGDAGAIDGDIAAVAQAFDMVPAVACHLHRRSNLRGRRGALRAG
jgi:hypothetical protein